MARKFYLEDFVLAICYSWVEFIKTIHDIRHETLFKKITLFDKKPKIRNVTIFELKSSTPKSFPSDRHTKTSDATKRSVRPTNFHDYAHKP